MYYANKWWDGRNTRDYADYSNVGGDCANFVSQCLIDGGMDLVQDGNIPSGHIGIGGTITWCDSLHAHLKNFQHAEVTFGENAGQAPFNLSPGDVVIFGRDDDIYSHAAIVATGNGGNVLLAAHSGDHNDLTIDGYLSWLRNKFGSGHITFYHFPTYSEIGREQVFYGTSNYVGEKSLISVVYQSGTNYEGYIVDSTDDSDQDLVVGDSTTALNGCAHYISAYCTDAHKGIPSDGQTFGQPWTSETSNHWAYWVRKGIQYANQHDYSSLDVLSAVWYITDRTGYYNSILSGIAYPLNGPTKNAANAQTAIGNNSLRLVHNECHPIKGEEVTILYNIASPGKISIKIYTVDGVLVRTVVDGSRQAGGAHVETWDGRNTRGTFVASGIYLLHLEAPGWRQTKKICIIK